MRRVVLGTRSAGKVRELRPLFTAAGLSAIDLVEAGIVEVPNEAAIECHATFEDNALAKARYFHAVSGLPTCADDSGLMVDALEGRPGVHSKRWSGRDDLNGLALDLANNAALLRALAGAGDRRARYVCAAAYVDADEEFVRRGETGGEILEAPRGEGGFGYDPYFFSHDLSRTFAEVTGAEKEAVSHRGRAFRALLSEAVTRR